MRLTIGVGGWREHHEMHLVAFVLPDLRIAGLKREAAQSECVRKRPARFTAPRNVSDPPDQRHRKRDGREQARISKNLSRRTRQAKDHSQQEVSWL